MHKRLFTLLIGISLCFSATLASEQGTEQTSQPIRLHIYANYGYNYTYRHQAGLSAVADVSINPHFVLLAGVQALSTNAYTVSADLRPRFPLSVGNLYLSTRLLYTAMVSTHTHDAAASVGLGYQMDYVDVQLGLQERFFAGFQRSKHAADQLVFEAPSLLYGVEAYVRPLSTSPWNVSLRIANYDDFQIERMWQPLFRIGGYYTFPAADAVNPLVQHWRLLADLTCKPTGMFHLNASFYGITARLGVAYQW